jgi:hopanoid biosynthesis associated protein HpnK
MQVIVNADDFGLSKEVNAAVIRAFTEGVLTSCSLMVTGEAFDEAVLLAKKHSGLGVGLHLVTVCGRSVLSPSQIPSLVDSKSQFASSPRVAGLKYFFSRRARSELRQELSAQFEKFHATGLPFSHIDGHLHMHVHPVIFKAAVELGIRYNVKRMRVPHDDLSLALRFDPSATFKKLIHASIFGLLSGFMKGRLRAHGFLFSGRVYGLFQTGKMNEAYFLKALQALSAQSNEIYFHPALYDVHPRRRSEQPQAEVELDALTSPRVIELFKRLAVQRISYFELEKAR